MRIATLVIATSLTLLSTIAHTNSVTHDFDKATDFSRFKTYAWARGTGMHDPLNDQRIANAIDAQLASKGLTKVSANAEPDMLVAFHTGLHRNLRITGPSAGWGAYRFGGAGPSRIEQIPAFTLVVDLMDAETHALVWRGVASGNVDVNASSERREKNINKSTARLFRNYPPKQ